MTESLDAITKIIEDYRNSDVIKEQNGAQLNDWLKNLTGHLFALEKERATYKKNYEMIVHKWVSGGYSVARAINIAEVQCPELYMLRHITDAGWRVADAMRSNLSYIKFELNNLNL